LKSIKPGRGPSAMGAIGSVAIGIFGVFWTIGAANMGAPIFFVFFGIVFVGLAVVQGIYHYKNATGKNRMSVFDFTDHHEEPDPLERYVFKSATQRDSNSEHYSKDMETFNYCPFCGEKVINDAYRFCPKCGKEISR
jgi:ribosomal protein L32